MQECIIDLIDKIKENKIKNDEIVSFSIDLDVKKKLTRLLKEYHLNNQQELMRLFMLVESRYPILKLDDIATEIKKKLELKNVLNKIPSF